MLDEKKRIKLLRRIMFTIGDEKLKKFLICTYGIIYLLEIIGFTVMSIQEGITHESIAFAGLCILFPIFIPLIFINPTMSLSLKDATNPTIYTKSSTNMESTLCCLPVKTTDWLKAKRIFTILGVVMCSISSLIANALLIISKNSEICCTGLMGVLSLFTAVSMLATTWFTCLPSIKSKAVSIIVIIIASLNFIISSCSMLVVQFISDINPDVFLKLNNIAFLNALSGLGGIILLLVMIPVCILVYNKIIIPHALTAWKSDTIKKGQAV